MNNVYIVFLTSGSYSDWSMSNVCAFLDEQKANDYCEILQARQDRRALALTKKYDHMRAWHNDNTMPDFSIDEQRDRNKINSIKKHDRSAKQNKRLQEIQDRWQEIQAQRNEYNKAQLAEEDEFINSLDFLFYEDKAALTDRNGNEYYRTDGSYSVEEIELRE